MRKTGYKFCHGGWKKWLSCASSKNFADYMNFKPGSVMTWICLHGCAYARERRGQGEGDRRLRRKDKGDRVRRLMSLGLSLAVEGSVTSLGLSAFLVLIIAIWNQR